MALLASGCNATQFYSYTTSVGFDVTVPASIQQTRSIIGSPLHTLTARLDSIKYSYVWTELKKLNFNNITQHNTTVQCAKRQLDLIPE